MKVKVLRKYFRDTYTIGKLYIDGVYFCDTIEDKDRGLLQTMPLEMIKSMKVYGETAIPKGNYILRMDMVSPRYDKVDWYHTNFGGRMPRLENVKGYTGVLMHPGNTAKDSLGCIIVGKNKEVGKVLESRATFKKLWKIFDDAYQRKETIYLEVA